MSVTSQRDVVRVQMIQPIVPHYRVPFFAGIARRSDVALSLSTSSRIRALPPTETVPGLEVDSHHEYVELLGGALVWQRGLAVAPGLGPGAVLVISGNPRFLSNYPLMRAAKRRGLGVVWWGHAWSATSNPLWTRVRLRLMRVADVVLLYTDSEREELLKYRFDPHRVFALNNALDDERVASLIVRWRADQLDRFQYEQHVNGRRVLLFCGRLRQSPSTDLDVGLRALAQLVAKDHRYLLVVVGDGIDATRLKTLAAELEVTSHIRWLGAVYEEEELAPWFLTAVCFVYPGTVGLSLIQALGYGMPVVTHNNRQQHNPEIAALEDGVNGLTFPRGDHSALAACIQRICDDPQLRQRMSRSARSIIETRYSMAAMVERFVQAVRVAASAPR